MASKSYRLYLNKRLHEIQEEDLDAVYDRFASARFCSMQQGNKRNCVVFFEVDRKEYDDVIAKEEAFAKRQQRQKELALAKARVEEEKEKAEAAKLLQKKHADTAKRLQAEAAA